MRTFLALCALLTSAAADEAEVRLSPFPATSQPALPSRERPLPLRGREARIGDTVLTFEPRPGTDVLGLLRAGGEEQRGDARPEEGGFRVEFPRVPCGRACYRVSLSYRDGALVSATYAPAEHRRGTIALAGVVRDVFLVDADGDGAFDGPEDRWIALRRDRAARVAALELWDCFLLSEPQIPFEREGAALRVEDVAQDGASLKLVLDAPRVSEESVLERRYREVRAAHHARLAAERDVFVREYGLDPSRPRATPPEWRREPLSAALARARAEKKPLLVHYFTESNTWSYAYEVYTFPDREVAELLRRFTLVRIDVEKDPEKSFHDSGVKGFPALVPYRPDGGRFTFTLRTRDADGTTRELEGASAIAGWQRPAELAENLRRILR